MTILIADRSYKIRERLIHLVKNIYEDPTIFETESSSDAMNLVRLHKPTLVITDLDLQNGSGLSVLSYIKGLVPGSIKIVFTNHIDGDLELASKKLGADYFLSKADEFMQIKKILNMNTDGRSRSNIN